MFCYMYFYDADGSSRGPPSSLVSHAWSYEKCDSLFGLNSAVIAADAVVEARLATVAAVEEAFLHSEALRSPCATAAEAELTFRCDLMI